MPLINDWNIDFLVTSGGLLGGLTIVLRFFNIIFCSALFIAITDPSKLALGLMRLGLPYRFGFMLIIALRFVPLFDIESSNVQNAQKARGLDDLTRTYSF